MPSSKLKRDMVFKNPEYGITGINEKKKISDLVVEVKENMINLKMNKDYYDGLIDRNHEYMAKIRDSILKEGSSYNEMKKIIQINFDNYNIYIPDKRVVIKFEMLDKEKGIKEGKKEGLIEGKVEGKVETAKELLKNGIDINIIASCTGLSVDKIKNLDINNMKEHQK